MSDYNPPPVNAISGRRRKAQMDDRIDYETGDESKAVKPVTDDSKSRVVVSRPSEDSSREDPVASKKHLGVKDFLKIMVTGKD